MSVLLEESFSATFWPVKNVENLTPFIPNERSSPSLNLAEGAFCMANRSNRRDFMKTTAAAGAGFWAAGGVSPKPSRAAIDEISFGCIGVGGKGSSDSGDAKANGNVVAICDIDDNTLGGAKDKFPGARAYNDFRKMLDEMGKSIDAVTVSTPDHTHGPAALMAMRMGKHCFCQKPMTHSIYEARMMGNIARDNNLVTQMGNQGTATSSLRRSAAMIKAGKIGAVKEVHVWTNRPVWPQGLDLPEPQEVPGHVQWDLWLGPAKERPYNAIYHPFKWRGWWDFGTGALGDMACHTLNMSYMALDLKDPTSVQATTDGHNKQTYPKWSVIKYEFPGNDERGPVTMYWYDGGKRPPAEALKGCPGNDGRDFSSGALIIGEDANFISPGDYGGDDSKSGLVVNGEFISQTDRQFRDVKYTRSPGHFKEFANGIKGEGTPMSNFPGYATGLSEVVLLGNLSVWEAAGDGPGNMTEGPTVEWDAKTLKAKNSTKEIEQIVKPIYRDGYTLEG